MVQLSAGPPRAVTIAKKRGRLTDIKPVRLLTELWRTAGNWWENLERYDALLRLTTDPQAISAIEQLIRETRSRLNGLDRADDRSGEADC